MARMKRDDRVFKALADPTRRFLLDALRKRDGRTLTELASQLAMTRFGAMKHLRILEAARLVVTRREGRTKRHFLNAVPIRLIHDRWIDKYTEPWVSALSELKQNLERTMEKVFEIYIKTTPQRLWAAITDPERRKRFSFGVAVYSDWKAGSAYTGRTTVLTRTPGVDIFAGENVEVDPPRKLVQTFRALWSDEVTGEGVSRVTWEIEPVGDSCRLTVIHDRLREGANSQLYGGWPMLLSGLKTFLETGEALTTPASLLYLAERG